MKNNRIVVIYIYTSRHIVIVYMYCSAAPEWGNDAADTPFYRNFQPICLNKNDNGILTITPITP